LTKKPEDKNRRAALEAELKVAGVKVDQQLLEDLRQSFERWNRTVPRLGDRNGHRGV
jgi:hypothetical protein